jgi:hypothetical protein
MNQGIIVCNINEVNISKTFHSINLCVLVSYFIFLIAYYKITLTFKRKIFVYKRSWQKSFSSVCVSLTFILISSQLHSLALFLIIAILELVQTSMSQSSLFQQISFQFLCTWMTVSGSVHKDIKCFRFGKSVISSKVTGCYLIIPVEVYEGHTVFILNKIWVQDKIYILVGTLLGWNILPITYCYWLRTIGSTFYQG